MADGHVFEKLQRADAAALPIVEAFGEHFEGIANPGPLTRITRYASWYEGGEFIANVDGHLADGAVHAMPSHGRAYRLTLIARPAWRAA